MIDNQSSHEDRSSGEEVRSIAPGHLLLVHEREVELVNDYGWLKRRGFIPAQMRSRDCAQSIVDQRYELVQRFRAS